MPRGRFRVRKSTGNNSASRRILLVYTNRLPCWLFMVYIIMRGLYALLAQLCWGMYRQEK